LLEKYSYIAVSVYYIYKKCTKSAQNKTKISFSSVTSASMGTMGHHGDLGHLVLEGLQQVETFWE
jgi:hypothetical protein